MQNNNILTAAVLVPLFRRDDGELRLVIIRRGDNGIHAGELALPGGKHEAADATMLDTALRETREEIGLAPEAIEIIESLPLEVTKNTGFLIYPYLARIVPPRKWLPKAGEITEVLEVNVHELTRPGAHRSDLMQLPEWPAPRRISYYPVGPYRIWGATYRILSPLLDRIIAGEVVI